MSKDKLEKTAAVSKEIADQEVEKWLDFKKIDQDDIKDIDDQKTPLSLAIQKGYLSLDSDMVFHHKLKFPIEDVDGNIVLDKISYKPRLKMWEIESKTKGVDMKNTFALIRAYMCALTDLNSGMLKKLDSSDNKIAQGIALFFL